MADNCNSATRHQESNHVSSQAPGENIMWSGENVMWSVTVFWCGSTVTSKHSTLHFTFCQLIHNRLQSSKETFVSWNYLWSGKKRSTIYQSRSGSFSIFIYWGHYSLNLHWMNKTFLITDEFLVCFRLLDGDWIVVVMVPTSTVMLIFHWSSTLSCIYFLLVGGESHWPVKLFKTICSVFFDLVFSISDLCIQ